MRFTNRPLFKVIPCLTRPRSTSPATTAEVWAAPPPLAPILAENLEVDVAIVGAGFTGLYTATHLGVCFFERLRAERIEEQPFQVLVRTAHGRLRAQNRVLACNASIDKLYPPLQAKVLSQSAGCTD